MTFIPDVKAMYQDAARGLGGRLVCEKCGRSQACYERDAAGYLARGWPKCCGATMRLEAGETAP
jgi:hypothetical protein